MGDRECPICGEMSLIEEESNMWICLICKEVFNEFDLDDVVIKQFLRKRNSDKGKK